MPDINDSDSAPGSSSTDKSAFDETSGKLAQFVEAIELMPLASVQGFDRDGKVRFWSQISTELYGISKNDAIGKSLSELYVHKDSERKFADVVQSIWDTKRMPLPQDWQITTAKGKNGWIYSIMFPIFSKNEIQQILCLDIDISESKLEEKALLVIGGNFRQLFEKSGDAILIIKNNHIIDINPAGLALFHCDDREQIINRTMTDFSPPLQPSGEASGVVDARVFAQALETGNFRYEWRYRSQTNNEFWAEVLLTSISFDHKILFYAVIRDISERKKIEASLYLAAKVFANSREAILIADDVPLIVSANDAFTAITGYNEADVVGKSPIYYSADIHDHDLYNQIWHQIKENDHWQGEVWDKRKNGESFPVLLSITAIRDSHNIVRNYMIIMSDITERKKSEEYTRHLAEHDFLTDLPNRVLLLDRLSQALLTARRKKIMLAILFLDLDNFKNINDVLGHDVGDKVLKSVAKKLTGCIRKGDTVSRQGGDEFIIILSEIGGVEQVAHVAEAIMRSVAQVHHVDDVELTLSTSIGVSIFPNDSEDMDTLIKNADTAMYHAKGKGRNNFEFFNAEMNSAIIERNRLEKGLRTALKNNEFFLLYQPEININTGEIVGVEALIRWQHPNSGVVLPERFIHIAEECGLINQIGFWVLEQACQQARVWLDEGHPLFVSVNLSATQLLKKDIVQHIKTIIANANLPTKYVELEITESFILSDSDSMIRILTDLRELGLKLTIDDFGTGYSSLSYLKRFPIYKLKIDQSFMKDITGTPDDAAIITAIIAMGKSLKLKVIAEGVETKEQLQFLQASGCDEYQGFYGSVPLSPAELIQRLHL